MQSKIVSGFKEIWNFSEFGREKKEKKEEKNWRRKIFKDICFCISQLFTNFLILKDLRRT